MFEKIIFYYIPFCFDLVKAFAATAILTAVIETLFFFFFFKKNKKFLSVVFAANIVSNLALNIWLSFAEINYPNIIRGEFFVLIFEYTVFLFFAGQKGKNAVKLLAYTLLANVISYSAGLLLFGLK